METERFQSRPILATGRALHIPELVSLICGQSNLTKHCLCQLARTSKLFHYPAIAFIWEDIPNLVPLIKVMPSDLWEDKQLNGEERRRLVQFLPKAYGEKLLIAP